MQIGPKITLFFEFNVIVGLFKTIVFHSLASGCICVFPFVRSITLCHMFVYKKKKGPEPTITSKQAQYLSLYERQKNIRFKDFLMHLLGQKTDRKISILYATKISAIVDFIVLCML